jgi:hypothetical protein
MDETALCSQNDGRTAVVSTNGANLCVECWYKVSVAKTLEVRLHMIMANQAAAEMDAVTGLRNFSPKFQIPDIPSGPMILNNIHVADSVVGSINTGNVQTIDVSISYLDNAGDKEVSAALKTLTEAIANEIALAKQDRDNMLEQVAYLSQQAVASAKDRKPGMIKAALGAISQSAATFVAISDAWQHAEPLLKQLFHIQS